MQNWRLYLALTFVVLVSEAIGQRRFSVGPGFILLIPMLYALVLGFLLNPKFVRFLSPERLGVVPALTMLGIALLAARIGTTLGPNLKLLWSLSWMLALQEFGHFLGTVALGLPVAVLLGLGREAVGATFSLAREGALAIIGEKFGLDSPEGRGVLSQYLCGTLFGAVYFGFMAGWVDSLQFFSPLSLAMACGVGSVSMMAASAGSLMAIHPALKEQITAISGAANLLTMMTGLYFSIFVSLPLAQFLYKVLRRGRSDEKVS
ncbi:MAG: DUF3100 domain-containing protein [Armatimonadetes bacterium]|nr:DUF3100 domain-containing protein [Armatimonadota bacterium]